MIGGLSGWRRAIHAGIPTTKVTMQVASAIKSALFHVLPAWLPMTRNVTTTESGSYPPVTALCGYEESHSSVNSVLLAERASVPSNHTHFLAT